MARPTKYTPECVQKICEGIQLGMPYYQAAMYGGVSYETFRVWNESDPAFSAAVKEAESKAIAGRLARIRQAEGDHWQAAAWWLERRYPHDFGRTVQDHNVTVKHEEIITEVATKLGVDPIALAAEIKALDE